MNAAISSAVLTTLLLAAPAALAQDGDNDSDAIATLAGDELTRGDYEDWLFTRFSAETILPYIEFRAIERAARDLGIVVTDEEVAAAYEAEAADKTERFFQGMPERYELDMQRRGYTEERWRERRSIEIRNELQADRIVLAQRVVTDEEIAERFKTIYGQDAEQTTIEVIFFSLYHDVEPGTAVDRDELMRQSAERAKIVVAKMREGLSLAELRELSDPIDNKFIEDGLVEQYRRNLLGPALDKAINLLDRPGETTDVVRMFDGHAAARLVVRKNVTLEEATPAIRAELAASAPTSAELTQLGQMLRERYDAASLLND